MKNFFACIFALIIFCCSKNDNHNDNDIPSSENNITSFKLNINNDLVNGVINQNDRTISFNLVGADLSSLIPVIEYSNEATLSPSENTAQNFNNPINYTVVAENGDARIYNVFVENRPLGTENKIISFFVDVSGETIEALINEEENTIMFNTGIADISSVIPTITISDYATISPSIDIAQNFNNTIEYVVSAENGFTKTYVVIVNKPSIDYVGPSFSGNLLFFTGAELRVNGDFIDPTSNNAEFLLVNGTNEYVLSVMSFNSVEYGDNQIQYQVKLDPIPYDLPTSSSYRLLYRANNNDIEFEENIDILSNGPQDMILNQTSYSYNDVMVINGINLVPGLVVPSNGSLFIVENSNNYDIAVNSDGTQLTWTLDYYQHFPAYYGNAPEEKNIYTLGENRRVGKSITTIFN